MEADALIFVGGAPRSGTTLLRAILDSHPRIACGPELRVSASIARLWSETQACIGPTLDAYYHLSRQDLRERYAGFLKSFLSPAYAACGKPRLAEKTPANVLHFAELHELFPDSPLIHVIRDGRDVVTSLLEMDWTDEASGAPLACVCDPAAAARLWLESVGHGREMRRKSTAARRYHEIRYEDLVAEPVQTLRALFEFLGEPWDDCVLDFHRNPGNQAGINEASTQQICRPLASHSVGRWSRQLPQRDLETVMTIIGPRLRELGYSAASA